MDDRILRDMERRLAALERQAVRFRQGEVTGTAPLNVALGGASTPYADVATVGNPAMGDTVAALTWGNDMLVLGTVGAGGVAGDAGPWAVGATASTRPTIAQNLLRPTVVGTVTLATAATARIDGGMVIPANKTITNINCYFTTAGAGAVTSFWFAIVRAYDFTVLERTANSTTLPTATAVHTRALQATLTLTADTPVYIAVGAQFATTGPTAVADLGGASMAQVNGLAPVLQANVTPAPTATPPAVSSVFTVGTSFNGIIHYWLT